MKIGIYSPYLDTLGGGERYMLTIAQCLSHSHHVEVFWNDGNILDKASLRLNLDLEKVHVVPNIFEKSGIQKIVSTSAYDAIIALSDGSIPLSFAKQTIIHFQQPFKKVRGRSLANKLKLGRIHSVICNSNYTKGFIDQEYGVNSNVIYPPVRVSDYSLNAIKRKKVILSVGRFHSVKKHEILIQAFQKLGKTDWKLVIAGGLLEKDTDYFNSLVSTITTSNVLLKPNISFSELKELYSQATFYWHAAGYGEDESEHPERLEHFGIAPVEAMASGCIPLLYKGGGLVEIVEGMNNLLWIKENELIDKTNYFITHRSKLTHLQKQLQKRSRMFDESIFCSKIQELLS